jgi:tRNA threonylcarbamoyladenosine biosynthesis protein TsaE
LPQVNKTIARTAGETRDAGRALAHSLREGDVVLLYGDLGAGKTTFVKGMASALSIDEREIISASFTIIAEYESTPPLYHIDLYRLERPEDLEAVGLYEYLGTDGIAVVEWADRMPSGEVEGAIMVHINFLDDNGREIVVERPA